MADQVDRSDVDERALRVIVADDDALARRAVRDRLQDEGFVVVAEAAGGREAIELTAHYMPDLVVLDIVMPDVDGLTATREIAERAPEVRIVILSSSRNETLALTALRLGATGFVPKSVGLDGLPEALRRAHDGQAVVTPVLAMRLIEGMRRVKDDASGIRPVRSSLTSREWEILDLLCQDRSADDIAYELVLSVETVRSHVKSILRKLGVRSQPEAIAEAGRMRSALVFRRSGDD